MQLYPQHPGHKVNGPSEEAAQEMKSRAKTLRERILALLKSSPYFTKGLTADEAAHLLDESILAVRPRFSELLATGDIAASDYRRENRSGRSATVWFALLRGEQLTLL